MRSVPTTSLDLGDPDVVADPYPHFAEERTQHEVAWHEAVGAWLTFSHAAASAVLRDRRLGRLWRDREPRGVPGAVQPAAPQPDDGERAARAHPAAAGGRRRVQPRARRAAAPAGARVAGRRLLDEVDPAAFDVIGEYAEPLPVLVIAELRRRSRAPTYPRCGTGRRRSCGCTSRPRPPERRRRGRARRDRVRRPRARAPRAPAYAPRRGPDHRPARRRASATTSWSRPSYCCSTPATRRRSTSSATAWSRCCRRGLRPGADAAPDGRGDAALRLRAPALRAHRHRRRRGRGVPSREGQKIAALLGAANRDPAVFDGRPTPSTSTATPTRTSPSAPASTSASARRSRGWSSSSPSRCSSTRQPDLALAAEPESRGTFVLRGYHPGCR